MPSASGRVLFCFFKPGPHIFHLSWLFEPIPMAINIDHGKILGNLGSQKMMGILRKAISLINEFIVHSVQLKKKILVPWLRRQLKPHIQHPPQWNPRAVTCRRTEANTVITMSLPSESVWQATSPLKKYFLVEQTWTYYKVIYNNILKFQGKQHNIVVCQCLSLIPPGTHDEHWAQWKPSDEAFSLVGRHCDSYKF